MYGGNQVVELGFRKTKRKNELNDCRMEVTLTI